MLRLERQISQEELGRVLSVSFQQIQKYERGVNRIAAGTLFRLARRLNVPVEYFFEGLPEDELATDGTAIREPVPVTIPEPSHDNVALVLAFSRIKNPHVRRHLLKFIRELTEENQI